MCDVAYCRVLSVCEFECLHYRVCLCFWDSASVVKDLSSFTVGFKFVKSKNVCVEIGDLIL